MKALKYKNLLDGKITGIKKFLTEGSIKEINNKQIIYGKEMKDKKYYSDLIINHCSGMYYNDFLITKNAIEGLADVLSQSVISEPIKWQKERPEFACIFLAKHNGEYSIWEFSWEIGEPPEDANDDDTIYWYLSWTDKDGDEWGDIAECIFDEYLILELLPTMHEKHKQWIASQSTN